MRAFDAHRGTARGPVALEPSSRVTEPALEDDDSRASACVARGTGIGWRICFHFVLDAR